MNLTRYEPQQLLHRLQQDINNVFRFGRMPSLFDENLELATGEWAPAVNLKEEDKEFVITADIPGVDPKDIEVSTENGTLSLKGERKQEKESKEGGYWHRECSYGSFYRRLALPESADTGQIKAKGKNGVLEIRVAKKPESKPQRIQIESQE